MELEENFSTCSNCNKVIDDGKIMIHEAYCFRNFVKCLKCEEMIDKTQKKEHDDEFHKTINCVYCGKAFVKNELKHHELSCKEKPRTCNFCNLDIKFNEYSNHIYHCSTRTKQCEICNKFVIMRDYEHHQAKCLYSNNSFDKSFPPLNNEEEKYDKISEEEKKVERIHSKKKLESPKISQNQSPSLKKKNSKNTHEYNEYNDYWEEQDEIRNENIFSSNQNKDLQEPNILLPNLPLNPSISNDDPELQRILYESLSSSHKNK